MDRGKNGSGKIVRTNLLSSAKLIDKSKISDPSVFERGIVVDTLVFPKKDYYRLSKETDQECEEVLKMFKGTQSRVEHVEDCVVGYVDDVYFSEEGMNAVMVIWPPEDVVPWIEDVVLGVKTSILKGDPVSVSACFKIKEADIHGKVTGKDEWYPREISLVKRPRLDVGVIRKAYFSMGQFLPFFKKPPLHCQRTNHSSFFLFSTPIFHLSCFSFFSSPSKKQPPKKTSKIPEER
jgi:hypothetical protein